MFIVFLATTFFGISVLFVAWTYALYPLFVRLLRRYYTPIKKTSGYLPSFSIVVPAHNEAHVIAKKLENVLSLDYPKDKVEIIVSDDGSTDGTADIAQRYNGVKLIRLGRVGKTGAVNKSLEMANGEVVLLTDADSLFERDALLRSAQVFADPSIGAVSGRLELLDYKPSYIRKRSTDDWLSRRESLLDSISTGIGGFLAFRRSLIEKLDYECLADDLDITILVRMKDYRVVYDAEIVIYTWDPNLFSHWYKQTVRRTLQGLTTLFHHRSVLFNPRYGWYGTIILPTRLLLHRLTPFFLIIALISSFFINPLLALSIILLSLGAIMIIPIIRKMFVIQIIFLNAWGLFLLRRHRKIWKRGPRQIPEVI